MRRTLPWALVTRVKEAAFAGQIAYPFTAKDVDAWRDRTDPRKTNGDAYKIATRTMLSNATIREDGSVTPNKNRKFLRVSLNAKGEKAYTVDPIA